jgi:hypothetical protein
MEFGSDDEDESLKNDIARLVQTGGLDEDSDEAGGDGEAGEEEDDEVGLELLSAVRTEATKISH